VLVVALAVAAAALAGAAGADSPYEFVAGSAQLVIPNYPTAGATTTEQFAVSGHNGPNGPSGVIVMHSPLIPEGVAIADVTCVEIVGNRAVVGGSFRQPFTYLGETINQFAMIIEDNGPGNDLIHPVVFRAIPRPPGFQPCGIQQPLLPIDTGNYVISDAA